MGLKVVAPIVFADWSRALLLGLHHTTLRAVVNCIIVMSLRAAMVAIATSVIFDVEQPIVRIFIYIFINLYNKV